MADDREQMIRDRAYSIWEEQGRPHGEDMRHWLQAWQELAEDGPAEDRGVPDAAASADGAAKPPETRAEKTTSAPKAARRKKS